MLERMPERIYQEWWQFYCQEPWGMQQTQMAAVLSVLTGRKIHELGAVRQVPKIKTEAEWRRIHAERANGEDQENH
jgi:hypothetical protein